MNAPAGILQLVARFDLHRESYTSGQYNETQFRREFIDPFFKCLGWDVENKLGYAEAYKDVIHEDAIKIGGRDKAPDYCFRIGGTRKFFVEAKKPSVISERRYQPGVSTAALCLVGQTSAQHSHRFRGIRRLRLPVKPVKTDKASTARIYTSPTRIIRPLGRDRLGLLEGCRAQRFLRQVRGGDEGQERHGRGR